MRAKDDQNFWNFWLLVFSGVVLVIEVWILVALDRLPTSIGWFDFALITLATFRLTRLFVYDTIMHFLRDWFLKREVSYHEDGTLSVERTKYPSGLRRAMSDLFSCPWCMGLQMAIFVVFFYYLTPLAWIVILMLAVAGVATFLQLLSNMVGHRAEELKIKNERSGGSSGPSTCG